MVFDENSDVPNWGVRKMRLSVDGALDEVGIPRADMLDEDEMLSVMKSCEPVP